jgi:tyrosine-protein kinase
MSTRQPTPVPDAVPEGSVDLRSYLAVLRRSRRLIALIVILSIGAAVAYTYLSTPVYTAKALVSLQPVNVSPEAIANAGVAKLVLPETEQAIATSLAVATIAQRSLGSKLTPQELLKKVQVTVAPESAVMEILYTDQSAQQAARGAEAWAQAYIKYRSDGALDQQKQQLTAAQTQLAILQKRLHRLRDTGYSATAATISASIGAWNAQVIQYSGENTVAGQLAGDPAVPQHPSSPNKPLNLALGLFFGLFLGVGLAFFRSRTDTKVRERSDLESALRTPVLAIVPQDKQWTDRKRPRVVTLEDPRSPVAEAFRALRPSLLVAAAERDVKTIMIVSPAPGEGKSTTAANLGVVLAQADKRVVLISADLRKARLHDFFGVKNERGLSDVLTQKVPPWESLRRTPVDNLWVLPSGRVPGNPAELLQSQAMRDLLAEQRGVVDFILIDCPPVLAVADSLGLAPMTDGVLFVADAGTTTIEAAEQARASLDRVGANVIGSVLNDLDVSSISGYYGYGYGYGYGYSYPEIPARAPTNGQGKKADEPGGRRKNRAR